jgi:hypothetical protein
VLDHGSRGSFFSVLRRGMGMALVQLSPPWHLLELNFALVCSLLCREGEEYIYYGILHSTTTSTATVVAFVSIYARPLLVPVNN